MHYYIEEFRTIATKKVFRKVFERINNKELPILRYKNSMITLQYENTSKRYDKTKRKQMNKILNMKDNELTDNCFYIACCLLIQHFDVVVEKNSLKNKDWVEQIEIVNCTLRKIKQEMKHECSKEGIITNIILNIKGKAMIIFNLDNDICHAEAIKDGEVMDKDGSCIWKYE